VQREGQPGRAVSPGAQQLPVIQDRVLPGAGHAPQRRVRRHWLDEHPRAEPSGAQPDDCLQARTVSCGLAEASVAGYDVSPCRAGQQVLATGSQGHRHRGGRWQSLSHGAG
jgi:hypothetical protein